MTFLQLLAQTWFPLKVLLFFWHSLLTLFFFATLPSQKLHLPDWDHPTTPLLHLQHCSVVPKIDQSSSSCAISSLSASVPSATASPTCSNAPTTFLQLLAQTWFPLKVLLFVCTLGDGLA